MNCDAEDLYSKPHEFFKWLFYLQQKINEKVNIMEEKPASVASKSYIYRKLKELPFASILNRRSFKSLHLLLKIEKPLEEFMRFGVQFFLIAVHCLTSTP